MKRTCCICKTEKKITEFSKDKHDPTGYTYSCKVCRREKSKKWYKENPDKVRKLIDDTKDYRKQYYSRPDVKLRHRLTRVKREFGLEPEEYLKMFEEQNHKCFICGNEETSVKNKNLSVDHCHKTGKIRALLCNRCNTGIGQFEDNPELLLKAFNYLKSFEDEQTL